MTRALHFVATFFMLALSVQAADTLYVSAIAEPGGDGLTWSSPYRSIGAAVTAAVEGDEIWVAQGTYPVTSTMTISNGVSLYGGFLGREPLRELRDWYRYPSVLLAMEETGTILQMVATDSSTRIDGIVFEGATTSAVKVDGGAPAFYNCMFRNNSGSVGGAIAASDIGRIRLEYCVFQENTSATDGGAVYLDGCNDEVGEFGPMIAECLFFKNKSDLGGGLHVSDCSGLLQLSSTVFVENEALFGGAISATNVYTYITNSTFLRNALTLKNLDRGRSIFINSAHVQNSAFYGGDEQDSTPHITVVTTPENDTATIVSRSNLVELDRDLGFWTSDPQFEDIDDVFGPDGFFGTDDDGLRLQWSSPIRDGGVIDQFVNHQNTDVIGNPRLVGRKVDCGAYETQRPGRLTPPEVMAMLREGSLVLYFRHAKTDWDQRDRGPSAECFPGRNLIHEGRDQSREIGKHMVAMEVPKGDGFSSTACRCWETCDLMMGYYEKKSYWAGGGGDEIMASRFADLQTPPVNGVRVIISHDNVANMIFNPSGGGEVMTTAELHEGDALMVRPMGDTMEVVAHWTSDTWERYHVRFPDEVVSVDEEFVNEITDLRVWPTPASSSLNFYSEQPSDVKVVDVSGIIVLTARVHGTTTVSVENLAPGVYMARDSAGRSAKILVR